MVSWVVENVLEPGTACLSAQGEPAQELAKRSAASQGAPSFPPWVRVRISVHAAWKLSPEQLRAKPLLLLEGLLLNARREGEIDVSGVCVERARAAPTRQSHRPAVGQVHLQMLGEDRCQPHRFRK